MRLQALPVETPHCGEGLRVSDIWQVIEAS